MESLEKVMSSIQKTKPEISQTNLPMEIPYWNLLQSEKVTIANIPQLKVALEENYKIKYSDNFMKLLSDTIIADGWNIERLESTLKWFLRTNPYPNWNIASFFGFTINVHNYAWYLEQIAKGTNGYDIESYKLNGKVYYKLIDGVTLPLPFEKIIIEKKVVEKISPLTEKESLAFLEELRKAKELIERESEKINVVLKDNKNNEETNESSSKSFEW